MAVEMINPVLVHPDVKGALFSDGTLRPRPGTAGISGIDGVVGATPGKDLRLVSRARLYPKLKPWRSGLPTVVLIEDMDSIRRELEYFIRQAGMEDATVTPYKSASRAWSFIEKNANDIDLIITDYQLSERSMSGLDLVLKVRSERGTKHIPIVMLTVTQDRELRRRAITAGATAYFIKPMEKMMAPELFAGLMRQTRAHRETSQQLKEVLKGIGADIQPEDLQAIVNMGACQLVPQAEWQRMISMAKAIEALGGEMKGLSGLFAASYKERFRAPGGEAQIGGPES